MAKVWRRCAGAIAAAMVSSAAAFVAPVAGHELYDRPVLAVDPGMHTASIRSLAVDRDGRFAITGGDDCTVRIWSTADGRLLQTIWVPVGTDRVGAIHAVAISPDGSTIAVGGWTEQNDGDHPIYLFDRETGGLIKRIQEDVTNVVSFLAFSPDGRYLVATLGYGGLRVFDRGKDWSEASRDAYDAPTIGAAFAPDGRLATTSLGSGGTIRLYDSSFRLVGKPVKAPSGNLPFHLAFSRDGRRLAVGYAGVAAVDLLDARTLDRMRGPSRTSLAPGLSGLDQVAWSPDGRTLYASGSVSDGRSLVLAWDEAGLGPERRLPYCGSAAATGLDALPDGRVLVTSFEPCLSLTTAEGRPVWTTPSPLANFASETDDFKVSADGAVVDFGVGDAANTRLRFDVRLLHLVDNASTGVPTFAPNRDGLPIEGWRNGPIPTLRGRAIPIEQYDMARSLAIAQDGKRFFLGSSDALAAYDDAGAGKWLRNARSEVWAVNASKDGRIVVAAYGDGAIRWYRADDGRELLALQVFANKTDWVLWTPEGFYHATPGAEEALKWVVNRGPDSAATKLPVSAIPKLHRPDALRLVLDELETARALGIADVSEARLLVQTATGSANPPGGVLHVLAIGVDHFGDKAGSLHLDYAVDDAHDVASALLTSQKIAPGKASLYADVSLQYLLDDRASAGEILEAMANMAQSMRKSGSDQDVAVILFSGHGEVIEDKFYLIPYGVDVSTPTKMERTAIWVEEFATKVRRLAERGKVLLLLDACHSGAVGPNGSSAILDGSALRNAVNMDNVSVLTSSSKDELSREDPAWRHGAFTKAFLDAVGGGADPLGRGVISTGDLAKAMKDEVERLTNGQQHVGMHLNFADDVFVVSH
jgi:WD40 repeat protein